MKYNIKAPGTKAQSKEQTKSKQNKQKQTNKAKSKQKGYYNCSLIWIRKEHIALLKFNGFCATFLAMLISKPVQ